MNPFQKLYHWLLADLFIFFALRPMLGEWKIVPDLKAWSKSIANLDLEGTAAVAHQFKDVQLVELAVSREHEWNNVMRALDGTGSPLVGVHIRTGHWRTYRPGVLTHHPLGLKKWIEPTLVHGSGTIDTATVFRGKIQPVGSKIGNYVPASR